jgi:hypothetical protein
MKVARIYLRVSTDEPGSDAPGLAGSEHTRGRLLRRRRLPREGVGCEGRPARAAAHDRGPAAGRGRGGNATRAVPGSGSATRSAGL